MSEQPKRKSDRQVLGEHAPWKPVAHELADAGALQALMRGDASPDQQKHALRFVIESVCGTYDLSYRPGDDGRRDTDFAEGRRFCGLQIVKFLKLNLSSLRRDRV